MSGDVEAGVIDTLDLDQLRRLAHHQRSRIDQLYAERERHLAQVEASFARRHNQQQARLDALGRKPTNPRRTP